MISESIDDKGTNMPAIQTAIQLERTRLRAYCSFGCYLTVLPGHPADLAPNLHSLPAVEGRGHILQHSTRSNSSNRDKVVEIPQLLCEYSPGGYTPHGKSAESPMLPGRGKARIIRCFRIGGVGALYGRHQVIDQFIQELPHRVP